MQAKIVQSSRIPNFKLPVIILFGLIQTGQARIGVRSAAVQRDQHRQQSESQLPEHMRNFLTALALARDGGELVSASVDGSLRVWNTRTGRLLRTIRAGLGSIGTPWKLALSPDGKLLTAIVERENNIVVKIWNVGTGEELHTFDVPETKPSPDTKAIVASVVFSPDGRWLALGGFCKVFLLDVATGRLRHTLTITPDPIEELRKGNALVDLVLIGYLISNMAFSPDARYLSVGQIVPESSLQLWDTATGTKLNEIIARPSDDKNPIHTEHLGRADFSRDGRLLFTMKTDPAREQWLVIRDAATLQELRRFPASGMCFGFNTDADGGALMLRDNEFDLLDIATGKVKRKAALAIPGATRLLVISGDGKWMATDKSETIYLWNLLTGRRTVTLRVPRPPIALRNSSPSQGIHVK